MGSGWVLRKIIFLWKSHLGDGVRERVGEEIDQEQDISTERPDNVGDPDLSLAPCMYDGFFSFTGVHTAAWLCESQWPVEGMI